MGMMLYYLPMNVIERFWSKVKKTKTCWLWTAATLKTGYGVFDAGTGRRNKHTEYAHRFAMQLAGFPLPQNEGHHACPNKNCVRIHPDHVVVVPRQHNPDSPSHLNRLKTHCKRGHLLAGKNLIRHPKHRICRLCASILRKERRTRMTDEQRQRERAYQRNYLKTHPEQYKKLLANMKKKKLWLRPEVKKRHAERQRERNALHHPPRWQNRCQPGFLV